MKQLFLFLGLFLFLAACTEKTSEYTSRKATTDYAKNFRIIPHDDYTELQLLKPETGEVEHSIALVKKTTKSELPPSMMRVEVPVKNMAVLSVTHIGMLGALNALDCIKGTTDPAYVSNPKILKGIKTGQIAALTDEASLVPEQLLRKKIGLIVYSGFGKAFPNADKLATLGILTIPNYDWREEHPLGKAEWIKVFGYLIDQPEKAEAYFKQVERNYLATKKLIGRSNKHPKVLVGSLIGDIWYAPAGQSYMAHLFRDAGCDYLYASEEGTGSCQKTFEQVYNDQLQSDFWINAGAVSIPDLLRQQGKYGLFKTVKKKQVYCYTHNSNYFWEMSTVHPDWLLYDFATIFGTSKPGKLHFYKQLQ